MGMGRKSGTVVLPPHSCQTLKLMSCILGFQHFSHPQDTELVFHSVNPFFCIQGFCGFLEDRWMGVHEILETAILVSFVPTRVYPPMGVICNTAQCSFYILLHALYVALASKKLCEKLFRSVRWRRRWWITVIITSCTATSLSGTIHGTTSVRHLHVSATVIIR
jgi:hypothetical protein